MRRGRRWLSALTSLTVILGMSALVGGPAANAAQPGNDNFGSASVLSNDGSSGSDTGTNIDATPELGETLPDIGYTTTVWWQWTAPASGTYLFDTCGSTLSNELGIYTGSRLDALTDVRGNAHLCMAFGDQFDNWSYELVATEGETYHLQVAGDGGAMGSITLRWWSQEVPGNDNFASAEELSSAATGSVTGNNRWATGETGEPVHIVDRSSVWYEWTPPSAGRYAFDTCGSNFDTRVGIYTGADVANLTEVATGDDDCAWQSLTAFDATATTYYIAVSSYSENTPEWGDFTLRWQGDAPPVNDNLADAVQLPAIASGSAIGNLRFASIEGNDPLNDDSIWWRWTAPRSGPVIFDTCGSNAYTEIQAFTAPRLLSDITAVSENNAEGCHLGGQTLFNVSRNVTYTIGVGGQWGDVALHWRMGTPPVNDDFSTPTQLVGAGGTATGDNFFASVQTSEPYTPDVDHSLWWKWVAGSDAPVTFDVCGTATFNPVLHIYTGVAVASLIETTGSVNRSCHADSRTFTPTAGTVYYIQVADAYAGMGSVVLHWPSTSATLPTVTTPTATVANGQIKVSWSDLAGTPDPTSVQCIIGKGQPQTCTEGQSFPAKGAKTVQVRAYNGYYGNWQQVTVTK